MVWIPGFSRDIRLMRGPNTPQTSSTPISALPNATQRPESPNPQPILPAKPMNSTAEK